MAAFTRSSCRREHDRTLSHRRPDITFLAGDGRNISTKAGIASGSRIIRQTHHACQGRPTGLFSEIGHSYSPLRIERTQEPCTAFQGCRRKMRSETRQDWMMDLAPNSGGTTAAGSQSRIPITSIGVTTWTKSALAHCTPIRHCRQRVRCSPQSRHGTCRRSLVFQWWRWCRRLAINTKLRIGRQSRGPLHGVLRCRRRP